MHRVPAPSTHPTCTKSPLIFPYRPDPTIKKRSSDLHRRTCIGAIADRIACLSLLRILARFITAITLFSCQITASSAFESNAHAQSVVRSESIDRFAKFIEEASGRFTIPARWIRAVLQIESGGDPHAISSRGAMGLIQLMPGTWVEVSVRHGLGLDPFDPRDNILAGAAYLEQMHDRFGSAGFLAAYHAGPARYQHHLATGQPLPQETTEYVAAVTPLLEDGQSERAEFRIRRVVPWREAPLFVERAGAP